MFQIDWSQAPDWAKYWATYDQRSGIKAWWYSDKPVTNKTCSYFEATEVGKIKPAPLFGWGPTATVIAECVARDRDEGTLPKTSDRVMSYDPSEEFSYIWIAEHKYGSEVSVCFYRSEQEAATAAKEEFYNFKEGFEDRKVVVARIVSVVNG